MSSEKNKELSNLVCLIDSLESPFKRGIKGALENLDSHFKELVDRFHADYNLKMFLTSTTTKDKQGKCFNEFLELVYKAARVHSDCLVSGGHALNFFRDFAENKLSESEVKQLREAMGVSNDYDKEIERLKKENEYYSLLLEAIEVLKFYESVDKNDEFIVGAKARSFLEKPEIKAILEEGMSYFDAIKDIECEYCKKTIGEVFESDEENEFLDMIQEHWYCSEWCYKKEDEEFN